MHTKSNNIYLYIPIDTYISINIYEIHVRPYSQIILSISTIQTDGLVAGLHFVKCQVEKIERDYSKMCVI